MRTVDKVRVTTIVSVDPATAFELFTQDIGAWWKRGTRYQLRTDRIGTMRFEPGVGGRLVEVYDEAGADIYEVGRILEWRPAERLVFEWRGKGFEAGERTEVEVSFERVEQGTRVTVEHRGWAGLPHDHPARLGFDDAAFEDVLGLWWADLLVAIGAHFERVRTSRNA